mmetsp:Transcript_6402/g.39969  ORF Transcript_6402/g.39969 Transcript_6402/m.39969 type:complete len:203 (-) Transcript_6402:4633-5241(-)
MGRTHKREGSVQEEEHQTQKAWQILKDSVGEPWNAQRFRCSSETKPRVPWHDDGGSHHTHYFTQLFVGQRLCVQELAGCMVGVLLGAGGLSGHETACQGGCVSFCQGVGVGIHIESFAYQLVITNGSPLGIFLVPRTVSTIFCACLQTDLRQETDAFRVPVGVHLWGKGRFWREHVSIAIRGRFSCERILLCTTPPGRIHRI